MGEPTLEKRRLRIYYQGWFSPGQFKRIFERMPRDQAEFDRFVERINDCGNLLLKRSLWSEAVDIAARWEDSEEPLPDT